MMSIHNDRFSDLSGNTSARAATRCGDSIRSMDDVQSRPWLIIFRYSFQSANENEEEWNEVMRYPSMQKFCLVWFAFYSFAMFAMFAMFVCLSFFFFFFCLLRQLWLNHKLCIASILTVAHTLALDNAISALLPIWSYRFRSAHTLRLFR